MAPKAYPQVAVWAITWHEAKDFAEKNDGQSFVDGAPVVAAKAFNAVAKKWSFVIQRACDEKGVRSLFHHVQGTISLKSKTGLNVLATKLAEYGVVGAHLSPAHNGSASFTYCTATDDATFVCGPFHDAKQRAKLDEEAMVDVKVIDEKQLFSWQQVVINSMSKEPDGRTVNWIVDWVGGKGKTTLAKYLMKHKISSVFRHMDARDASYIVASEAYCKSYVFDLTRTKPASVSAQDTYTMIEGVVDGFVTSCKYIPKRLNRRPAHCWVFSNSPPVFANLSLDRWKMWQFDGQGGLVPFKESDFEEYLEFQTKKEFQVAELRARKIRKWQEECKNEDSKHFVDFDTFRAYKKRKTETENSGLVSEILGCIFCIF